jgi:hypothetical protein
MKEFNNTNKLHDFQIYLLNKDLSELTLDLYIGNVNQFINYFEDTDGIDFDFLKVTIIDSRDYRSFLLNARKSPKGDYEFYAFKTEMVHLHQSNMNLLLFSFLLNNKNSKCEVLFIDILVLNKISSHKIDIEEIKKCFKEYQKYTIV